MNARSWPLLALVLAIIVYGSLYPFDFQVPASGADTLAHFLSTWRQLPQSCGDLLANLVFYAPLGFVCVAIFRGRGSDAAVIVASVILGATLSASMELLQYFDAGRVSCMSDFYLNSLGTLLGALAAGAWRGDLSSVNIASGRASPFALLVLTAWLGWRLFPYEPVIDLHKYWAALKPLVLSPNLTPYDVFRFATMWAAVTYLAQFGVSLRSPRVIVPAAMALIFLAKIVIADLVITLPEIVGATIALGYFLLVLQRPGLLGTRLLASTFVLAIVLERVLPWHLLATPRTFEWIPFFGFLHGSLGINVQSFLQKVFLYGTALILLTDSGLKLAIAAGIECTILAGTSFAETYLVGRSGEVTDTLMALMLAAIFLALPSAIGSSQTEQGVSGS